MTPEQKPSGEEATKSTPPPPASFKQFTTASAQEGPLRNSFMKAVPAVIFYCCRGYFLHNKYAEHWESFKGTVSQDAYVQLLIASKDIQKRYQIFTSN